jgi:hypothetical protein
MCRRYSDGGGALVTPGLLVPMFGCGRLSCDALAWLLHDMKGAGSEDETT